jgi:H+/gluconate symporter-like permease
MGNVALILVFGAMLGKLVDESGAAHAITYRLTDRFGRRNVRYAMALTGCWSGSRCCTTRASSCSSRWCTPSP